MVSTRVPRFILWSIWRDQIVLSKKHFVLNDTFKYFATNREYRDWPIVFRLCLFPFSCKGTTLAFLHSWRNLPLYRQLLKIFERLLQIVFPHSFTIRIMSVSWPYALFGSKWVIILAMLLLEKFTEYGICLWVEVDMQVRHCCYSIGSIDLQLFLWNLWKIYFHEKEEVYAKNFFI